MLFYSIELLHIHITCLHVYYCLHIPSSLAQDARFCHGRVKDSRKLWRYPNSSSCLGFHGFGVAHAKGGLELALPPKASLPFLTRAARWLSRKHIHVPEEHICCLCNHTTPEDWEHFKKCPLHTGRDTLVGWSPAETLRQHEGWPTHSHAHQATEPLFQDPLVIEATMRGAVTQALHRHLTKHTESPMEAAARLQLEAVRRAAAQMVHRKHLLLTHAEQLTDSIAREHLQRLIHYHAVHDPDVCSPTPRPARAPHLHPQASKTPPQRLEAHLSPKKPPGTAQPGRAQPGPTIRRRRRAKPRQPIQPTPSGPRAPPPHTGHHPRPRPPPSNPPRQGLTTPLGWYRLEEDWTKLTVKALRNLTTPGNGLHEAIVDLVLWRARKHTQGQHVWIPPSSGARP